MLTRRMRHLIIVNVLFVFHMSFMLINYEHFKVMNQNAFHAMLWASCSIYLFAMAKLLIFYRWPYMFTLSRMERLIEKGHGKDSLKYRYNKLCKAIEVKYNGTWYELDDSYLTQDCIFGTDEERIKIISRFNRDANNVELLSEFSPWPKFFGDYMTAEIITVPITIAAGYIMLVLIVKCLI